MSAARTRIMVVEDEQIVGHDIKQRLERMGYEVAGPVAAGDQVLAEIDRTHPSLLLMDVFLQGQLDGIQAADLVRKHHALPVIFLTAYSNEETLERAKRTAPFGFIHKPVADDELRTAVEIALYKKSLDDRQSRNETMLAVTLRNLGEAVVTADAAGKIEYMNRLAEQLSGWTIEEARGREIAAVLNVSDENNGELLNLHAGRAAGRLTMARAIGNCVLTGRDRRRIPVEVSVSGLADDPAGSPGLVVMIRDVSDRERARREIEDLQTQLEFVLMETGTNIDIIDTNFNLRYVDPGWRKIYGDFDGRKCHEYFMGCDAPCPGCGVIRAFATKSVAITEELLVRENNRAVQVTTVPYQSRTGEWLVAELNMDLTERKRVENDMRIQRDLGLALAAADSPAAAVELFLDAALQITGMDCGGIYLSEQADGPLNLIAARGLSDRFIQAVGRVAEETAMWQIAKAGNSLYILNTDAPPEIAAAIRAERLHGIAVLPIKHRDRLVGCCNLSSHTLRDIPVHARNTIELMLAQAGNVISRLQAEQAVRESEGKYRNLFDNAPVGYHEVDLRGCLTNVNATELKMLGYAAAEMHGRPIWDFLVEQAVAQAAVCEQLASGVVPDISQEWTFVRRDGAHLPVLVKSYALYDGQGKMLGIRSAIQDITEQKKAAAERARFEARMSEMQKLESIGLLAGGIAHDFNNLLMGIQGNVELALMKMPDTAPSYAFLVDVKTACLRAAELTAQLLAYAGKGKYVVQQINLTLLVREMRQLLQTLAGHYAELRLELAEDLPCVEGDAAQFRQLVMNLITNAVEAMRERYGVIRVATRAVDVDAAHVPSNYFPDHKLPLGKYIELVVQDDGCGIYPEGMRRLFEPFYTTKFMGRGLGLAAVLGIVRNHGGDIYVESQPDKGACFRILLPAAAIRPGRQGRLSIMDEDRLRIRPAG